MSQSFPGAVQVATKLRDFQLEYDERKFIFNFPAVADLINSDPDRYYVDLMADHDIVTWLTSAMRKQAELTRKMCAAPSPDGDRPW